MGNLKLGTKILFGFGVLIVMACTLGGIAVWQMKTVEGKSMMLAEEYVPEVHVANRVERLSLKTMYAIRGYAFTTNAAYLEEGRSALDQVQQALTDGRTLADRSPHLVKLKDAVDEVEHSVQTYKRLVARTEAKEMNAQAIQLKSFVDELVNLVGASLKHHGHQAGSRSALGPKIRKPSDVNQISALGSTA